MDNSRKVRVQVLLATCNGERYLQEFLDTLVHQQGVMIDLLASDDSSSDGTIEILESNKSRFLNCLILNGPGRGPMENFFHLIKHASGDYIAFADQDDLWDVNHLRNSCLRLKDFNSLPALSFSSVSEFGSSLAKQKIWPSFITIPGIELFFAQNYARGCTIVFNRELLSEVRRHQPQNAIMHDWWLLLLAYSIGKVCYSSTPEVLYRIHSNNFTRSRHQSKLSRILNDSKRTWAPHLQLRELVLSYGEKMNANSIVLASRFVEGCSGSFVIRLKYVLSFRNRLRDTRREDILVRARILIQPLLKFHNE